MPGLANQRFAFFKDGEISKCRVTKEIIFLQTSELARFKQSLSLNLYRHTSKDLPADYQRQDILREYESLKLEKLLIAAGKFWFQSWIVKGDNRTYPKPEEIINWLMTQGFSKSLAKHATTIIRPEYAGTGTIKSPEEE